MKNLILALDCSLQSLTLALFTGDALIAEVVEPPLPQQSSLLLKKIDELLKKSNHALSEITDVLYAYGPGSFTSLRIGLATLQGLFLDSASRCHVVSSSHDTVRVEAFQRIWREKLYDTTSWTNVKLNYGKLTLS
jgi:tRNA threonylcarbamoyl adenosine modification protein YeaZ